MLELFKFFFVNIVFDWKLIVLFVKEVVCLICIKVLLVGVGVILIILVFVKVNEVEILFMNIVILFCVM